MAQLTRSKSKEGLRTWLRLLSLTTMVEGQLRKLMRRHFGMTLSQFDLLAALERAGEAKTMSEISRMLMVSNGNVTGLVDRLSEEGLVVREPSEEDRRVYRISLTEEGRRRFREMAQRHEAWLAEMFKDIDGNTLESLGKTLKSVRERLSPEDNQDG